MKPEIKIEIYQQDWIPGFAAFANNGQIEKDGTAHVMINIGSLLCAAANGDIENTDLPYIIAECLMHEITHALECWAGVEFSEEKVEELTEKYRASIQDG